MKIARYLLIAAAVLSSCHSKLDSRGARPVSGATRPAVEVFEPAESSALFVGVRLFRYDPTLAEVRYAVDDAIDLAALLALDERIKLVEPSRVVLALSGGPEKPESQRSLHALVAAGAQVRSADGPEILNLLDDQSRAAGRKGMFIVAFATHGFSKDGTQYLLTATSILRHQEGAISDSEVRDIAAQSDAARSLILIDACRERLTENQRGGGPDSRSAAPLLRAMEGVHGQAVLSAAAAGQYAYDDDHRRNGVFTAAIIDGLRCQAAADEHGMITVDSLASFVEQHVLTWIRRYRNAGVTQATQVSWEGSAKTMPLAACNPSVDARPAKEAPASSSPGDPSRSIAVVVLGDGGEPVPHLAAAANNAIRESGYQPVSLVRSGEWTSAALQELAAGRVEPLGGSRLPGICRAVLAGTVARTVAMDIDPSLQGLISTRLHLRFYLLDATAGSVLSAFDTEARGGGFTKESSEMQAWERAAAILRAEVRKIRWTESLDAQ
ncbi:MAG TPA: caspase family protein [Thermoanaerobaculia bacterium]|jgi:hypothetical protein|nr:caspase family protein [Thermoanaerobaculia bacterium]